MSRLEELIETLCPDGVEYKKLGDFCDIISGFPFDSSKFTNRGFRLMRGMNVKRGKLDFSESLNKYWPDDKGLERYKLQENDIIIAMDGLVGSSYGMVSKKDLPLLLVQRVARIRTNSENIHYIYHVISSKEFSKYIDKKKTKGTIPHITLKDISEFAIPLPPMEVQNEIARILDNFTELTEELTDELTEELTARKQQYEYYRDILLKPNTNYHKYVLGDIATVTKLAGFEFTKYVTYSNEGEIIALRGLNVKDGRLDLHDVKYIDDSDLSKLNRSKLHIGDMLFTYVGTIGQVALIDQEDKYYLAPNVALIRCDKTVLLPEYMRYYFQSNFFWQGQINRLLQSSSMKNIPMEKIRKFELFLPSLNKQHQIVNILDKFDFICSDFNIGLPDEIEIREKQYEYYRDKLLSFKEINV